jgi:tight adherence protein B
MAIQSTLLPPIDALPEFAGILREQENFATGDSEGLSEQINSSFDKLMLQSGLEISPTMLLLLSVCSAFTLGGILFVIQENFLTTGLATGIGFVLPVLGAVIARSRRQTELMRQMPGMVDELARAAKTGRSLEQCFSLVAEDTPSPLGDELKLCAKKVELGVALGPALKELPERTGLVSLNVFVMALAVHQQTGGDLVSVLDRLAHTIRDRIAFLGRLRAATAASRASAIMMIGLPPAIVLFFIVRDPEYFSRLMNATWGRNLTLTAVVLQIIGAIWVMRILKTSQRT